MHAYVEYGDARSLGRVVFRHDDDVATLISGGADATDGMPAFVSQTLCDAYFFCVAETAGRDTLSVADAARQVAKTPNAHRLARRDASGRIRWEPPGTPPAAGMLLSYGLWTPPWHLDTATLAARIRRYEAEMDYGETVMTLAGERPPAAPSEEEARWRRVAWPADEPGPSVTDGAQLVSLLRAIGREDTSAAAVRAFIARGTTSFTRYGTREQLRRAPRALHVALAAMRRLPESRLVCWSEE